MSDDSLRWLLPILERRAGYPRGVSDREAAARLAALANLPRGWVLEDPED